MTVEPESCWSPQDVGDSRARRRVLGRAEDREANTPRREKCVAGDNTLSQLQVEPSQSFDTSPRATGFGVCPLANYFLTKPQFLHSGMVMYILCHCVFECDACFRILSVVTAKEIQTFKQYYN